MTVRFDDSRVFDAAGIFAVRTRRENRGFLSALEAKAILARREAEANDVIRVVARCAIQHFERALIIDNARIADDEAFPRLLGIR